MPPRASKHGRNKRTNASSPQSSSPTTPQPSFPFSPPTQLPTPLPERDHDKPPTMPPPPLLETPRPLKLVDVETPPSSLPPMGIATSPVREGYDDGEEEEDRAEEDLSATYTYSDTRFRSPPFRDATLPVDPESPQPLPIRPRVYQSVESIMDLDAEEEDERVDVDVLVDGSSYTSPVSSSSPTSAHPYIIPQTQRSGGERYGYQHERQEQGQRQHRQAAYDGFSQDTFEKSALGQTSAASMPGYKLGISQHAHKRGVVSQQEFEREYERTWDETDERTWDERDEREVYHPQPTRPGLTLDTKAYEPMSHQELYQQQGFYQPYSTTSTFSSNTAALGSGFSSNSTSSPIAPRIVSPTSPIPSSRFLSGYGASMAVVAAGRAGVVAAAGKGSGLAQAIRRGGVGFTGSMYAQGGEEHSRELGATGRGGEVGTTVRGGEVGAMMMRDGLVKTFSDKPVLAKWDTVNGAKVLVLGYEAGGVQVYTCENLGGVEEVVNVRLAVGEVLGTGGGEGEGEKEVGVVDVCVLREPSRRAGGSGDLGKRPLLGVLTNVTTRRSPEFEGDVKVESVLVVYSLHTHEIVRRVAIPGVGVKLEVGNDFVVVSTVSPASLVILSSATFKTLYTVPESSLELFAISSSTTVTTSSYLSSGTAYQYSHSHSSQTPVHSDRLSIRSPASAYGRGLSNATPVFLDQGRERHSISLDDHVKDCVIPVPSPHTLPRPVFSLNNRLLAYASPSVGHSPLSGLAIPGTSTKSARRFSASSAASLSPNLDVGSIGSTHSTSTSTASVSSTSSALNAIGGGLRNLANRGIGMATGSASPLTQKELGNAAIKVGESVFSGMKFLGGKAVEALSSAGVSSGVGMGVGGGGGGTGRVSRSAPDGGMDEYGREDVVRRMREREARGQAGSVGSEASESPNPRITTVAPETRTRVERGSYVAVVDLWALSPTTTLGSSKVAEFLVSRSQAISGLRFTPDGTSVAAILADGHFVRTFRVNPIPRRTLVTEEDKVMSMGATHVYNLRRGRTYASIEGCEIAHDGRWTAIATNHRTVHLFATNPYGGPSDVGSHFDGRVRNVEEVQFPMTELNPIARLRPKGTPSESESSSVPLAFTFLTPADLASSSNLLPIAPQSRHATDPTSSPLLGSPKATKKHTNYQDILLFDPLDSTLSLYRLTIDKHLPRESGIAASVHALGVTSISLPGLGGAGKLGMASSSPSKGLGLMGPVVGGSGAISRTSSSSTNRDRERGAEGAKEVALELSVKGSVVATWSLAQRGREWAPVMKSLAGGARRYENAGRGGDWLAEAEITTCSKSTRVLPRSLYLSHQFSFHTLGEDYHALIRRLHLDIVGPKIEVRTTVSINTYSSPPTSGAFMEDFSSPRDIRRLSSTSGLSPPSFDFDEPLANAISGSFDNTNIPAILPMFPNGVSGSTKPKSFRNSIPIRTMTGIGDGVSEGIGRLRSQMNRGGGSGVSRPQLIHQSDSSLFGHVPLEFDEEDEDFLDPRDVAMGSAAIDIPSPLNVHSYPHGMGSDFMNADVLGTVDEEIFQGWEAQDRDAIEEVEEFHHVSPSRYARDDVDMDLGGDVKLESAGVGTAPVSVPKVGGSAGKKKKKARG